MFKVTWKPAPLYNPQTDTGNYTKGRSSLNHVPIAIVSHRMVGYLTGTDRHFADPAVRTSTHFGIGTRYAGGPVEISQYVDLNDTAFANGNYDPSGGWPLVLKMKDGTIDNPNYYTVSIEHQDGGEDERGVVSQEIKNASLWLQSLLLTGNLTLIREAGIRCYSARMARGLGAIVPGPETIIDHNRIAGRLKPHCWRQWLDDEGFITHKSNVITHLLNQKIDRAEQLITTLLLEADADQATIENLSETVRQTEARLEQAREYGRLTATL